MLVVKVKRPWSRCGPEPDDNMREDGRLRRISSSAVCMHVDVALVFQKVSDTLTGAEAGQEAKSQ